MAYAVLGARPNSHPFQERKVDLKEPVKIGRAVAKCKSSSNNLIFDCKVLSRSHAVIWYEDGKFYIQDTKSSNGTYVNSTQVGRASDDSESVEMKSGDIVQFGVDVTENSKKVTHGCIIATVTLIHPDGTEALPDTDSETSKILPLFEDKNLKAQELWQLSRYLQEALNREQMLEQKLATMQRMIANSSAASEETLQAFVKEDELLSRLDILENELEIITKETNEDNSKKLLLGLEEEKEFYEKQAKETIKRLLQEKVDALQKLTDVQRTLSYSEDECCHMKSVNEKNETEIKELMDRHEQRAKELQNLQEKLDAAIKSQKSNSDQLEKERHRMKGELEDAEKRGSTLAVQVESLQAECDFTKKQLTAIKEKLEKNQLNTSEKTEEKLLNTCEVTESVDSTQQLEGLVKLHTCLVRVKETVNNFVKDIGTTGHQADEINPFAENVDEEKENISYDHKEISDVMNSDSENQESCYDNLVKCCKEITNIEEKLKTFSSSVEYTKFKNEKADTDSHYEIQNLRKEIIQLNETITNEQGACQKYKELAEKFEVNFAAEECRRQLLKEALDMMFKRVGELQKHLDAQESKEITSEKESFISKLEEEQIQLKNRNESLNNRIQQMENDLIKLKEDNDSLRAKSEPVGINEGKGHEGVVHAQMQVTSNNLSKEQEADKAYTSTFYDVQGTSQLLVALVMIFIAFGAAILLDVINVSFGNSPMLDPEIWKEIYENLF